MSLWVLATVGVDHKSLTHVINAGSDTSSEGSSDEGRNSDNRSINKMQALDYIWSVGCSTNDEYQSTAIVDINIHTARTTTDHCSIYSKLVLMVASIFRMIYIKTWFCWTKSLKTKVKWNFYDKCTL